MHTIVLSTMVDSTIREGQLDTDFTLFRDVEELSDYIESNTARAEKMYITEDVLSRVNTALGVLSTVLESPFISIGKIYFLLPVGAVQTSSIQYLIEKEGYTNWTIIEMAITRESVQDVITGTGERVGLSAKRKTVYRVERAEYVADRIKEKAELDKPYVCEEDTLSDIPIETLPACIPLELETTCENVWVCGLNSYERTATTLLIGQYLAMSSKTVLVEKDVEYHTLTEMAMKGTVLHKFIDIKDLLQYPEKTLYEIKGCQERLVIVGCVERVRYSYDFIVNLLFSNLQNNVEYLIVECLLDEVPSLQEHIMVVPTKLPELLKTCENIDGYDLPYMNFVGVSVGGLEELQINNSTILRSMLSDLVEYNVDFCPILNITSLGTGGDMYDLRSIIRCLK